MAMRVGDGGIAMHDEAVLRLWDELADFHVSQSDQAVAHLMAFLAGRVGAWNATWAGAIRFGEPVNSDPLQAWRVGAMQALHAIEPHREEGHFKEILKVWDRREIDPLLPAADARGGRVPRLLLPPRIAGDMVDSAFYRQHYGAVGTQDAVFVTFPLNGDCESHFGFYAGDTFTDEQIVLLARSLGGIKWFHRNLLPASGLLMASTPLTPTERKVLQLLLTKASEKEIAHHIKLTPSTVHQHITRIFRKFGVSSRAALMGLWLNPTA